VDAWRRAQVVYRSRSWEGRPEARALAEEIALDRRFESPLWDLLGVSRADGPVSLATGGLLAGAIGEGSRNTGGSGVVARTVELARGTDSTVS